VVQAAAVPAAPFDIEFLPERRRFTADGPVPLYLAAAGAGILLEQPCGSQGVCGDCRVRVIEGTAEVTAEDRDLIAPDDLAAGWRLGCRLKLAGPASIEVPAASRSLAGKSFGDRLPVSALARPVLPGGGDRLGLAIDIGTTSVAAALVRLSDGDVLASASRLNPQVAFGADVIARIHHATADPSGMAHLTESVRDGIGSLTGELLAECRRAPSDVCLATVAGNPTMLHAWAGVSVASLGVAPYLGSFTAAQSLRAAEVDLPIAGDAEVWVFPQVGSHVGGDAVAAAVACDLDDGNGRRLLIDLGTNSEVLVTCGGRVVATSAAAGPAFEGVSIRHGMRAGPGAIDVVSFADDGRVIVNTIGGAAPAGICGSGLIDLVAEMLRVGLVTPSGLLRPRPTTGADSALDGRLGEVEGQKAFWLEAPDTASGIRGVSLTARDIRELQLAKGSIVAAASLACRHLGFAVEELDEVLIAGAFGNYLRKPSALGVGLLPPIDPERIRLAGNAAGVGARLALVDRAVRERACRLAARTELVELATRADYQATFLDALAFPVR
jgi:uncharacterized 2Fe-2S/4Fe-4S cluster protein (DUF4445 family)